MLRWAMHTNIPWFALSAFGQDDTFGATICEGMDTGKSRREVSCVRKYNAE